MPVDDSCLTCLRRGGKKPGRRSGAHRMRMQHDRLPPGHDGPTRREQARDTRPRAKTDNARAGQADNDGERRGKRDPDRASEPVTDRRPRVATHNKTMRALPKPRAEQVDSLPATLRRLADQCEHLVLEALAPLGGKRSHAPPIAPHLIPPRAPRRRVGPVVPAQPRPLGSSPPALQPTTRGPAR